LSFAQGSGKKQGRTFSRSLSRSFSRGGHELRGARARVYQLSPEERQTFRRNAERWLQMGPDQRNALRQREQIRREHLKTEAEAAMRQLNLRLDQDAQQKFESRYSQERRKIERSLRKDLEDKRRQQQLELNQRLGNEFQPHQPVPAFTTSPGNR
jgi:hypothetical protein